MQINLGQRQKEAAAGAVNPQRTGKVTVSLNPVRQSVFIDIDGNEINPRTKQIIRLEKDVH